MKTTSKHQASAGFSLSRVAANLRLVGLLAIAWLLTMAGWAQAQTATTTTLSVNPAAIYVGQTATLTATVTGSSPTGTVTFRDGSTTLTTVSLTSGTATTSYPFNTTGSRSLTATYNGNAGNAASTSAAVTLTVNPKLSTTTGLSITPTTVYTGQPVTATATVSGGSSPTGTVTFRDGTTYLTAVSLTNGTASTSLYLSAVGAHSITATYNGDSGNATSVSSAVGTTTNPKETTTTTLTANPSPSSVNQTVTLSASVAGTNPTGSITFRDGTTYLTSANLASGVATATYSFQSTGTRNLNALYNGDSVNATSTSASVSQVVNSIETTTQLSCPASTPVATSVSCTVTVTAPVYASALYNLPATITLNGSTVASGTLSYIAAPSTFRATIVLPAAALPISTAGTYALVAQIPSTATTTASTASAFSLAVQQRATTTALTATPTTAGAGQIVTLSAAVGAGLNPGGTVTFRDGGTVIATAPLNAGQASITTSFSTAGSYSLTAVYNGDTNNAGSTSSTVTETVTATIATSTALSLSAASVVAGDPATLTATVSGGSPSGTVVFADGSVTLGSATLSGGQASISPIFYNVGARSLTATYWGDTSDASSTSVPVALTVTQRTSATGLTSALATANQSQPIPLTAAVSGANPGGTVSFREGSTTLGTANVVNGAAVFNASFTVLGSHTITASYAGDANNTASASAGVSVQIQPGPVPPTSAAPVVNYEYDAQGNPTKAIQAPGVAGFNFTTQASYDSLSRVKDTTNPKNGITRFQYDGVDRLTQVTDPRNLITQYPRNGLGDATSLVSPDTGTATHTYDEAGNLKTRTDSRSVLTTYSYDELNRLTQAAHTKTGMTSQTFGWTYDQTGAGFSHGIGRLTSTTHPAGSTQYAYDAQGRLTTDIQRVDAAAGANASQIVNTVGYEYDVAGNLTRITYPSGAQVSFGHTDGQVTSVSLARNAGSTAATLVSGIEFEPFGAIKRWQWHLAGGSTQVNERRYDLSARLTRYRLGNVLRDLTYDAADRITSYSHYDATTGVAQTSLNQNFGYDENGRLTTVTTASASWTIGYDANGNRTSVTLNGTPSTYITSTTSNRLNSITNPARSFGYDSAGNTTSDTAGYTSTYDAAGRLSTLTKAGVTTTYSYNGLGQRVRKFGSTGASSTVVFVYDQWGQLLGEYSSTGAAIREYVWLGSTPIAMFVPNGANDPAVSYLHTDHLNAPRIATDTSGNIRWRWMAEPFGTTAPEDNPSNLGSLTQNLRFPGQYADSESGLFYNYFRDYDSTIGRYTESDPIGLEGGINTYGYVGANPVALADPLGLKAPPSVLPRILPAATAIALADGPQPGPTDVLALTVLASAAIYDACTVDNDKRCREKLAEIYAAMDVIRGRIRDLLADKCDMYRQAFWVPNPGLTGGCAGTSWVGHLKAVNGWQLRLRKLIREALALKCNIPQDAWATATRPIPRAPNNGTP
jgi:RHS repeat-associated protein